MIIFATITLVDIIARADKDSFSMTTKDPAQVRGMQLKRYVHLSSIQAVEVQR